MYTRLKAYAEAYAGGRQGPYRHEYPDTEQVAMVRADALNHFGLADSTEGGNQIVRPSVGPDGFDVGVSHPWGSDSIMAWQLRHTLANR